MKSLKTIFLLPCLPYYITIYLWSIYLSIERYSIVSIKSFIVLKQEENYKKNIDRFVSQLKPFEWGYSFLFWVYFIKYILN